MTLSTALPTAQQIAAWLLEASGFDSGLGDSTDSPSRRTLQNAKKNRPIPRSWGLVINNALSAMGLDVPDTNVERVLEMIKRYDARISSLDGHGLPMSERLPVVLMLAIPEVGSRLGALAAAETICPTILGGGVSLADVVVDPFSERAFGVLLPLLFERFRPDLSKWEDRKAILARKGVLGERTIERWRAGDVEVPNLTTLEALATFMSADEEIQGRLRILLGSLRVFAVFRGMIKGERKLGPAEADAFPYVSITVRHFERRNY